MEKMKLYLYILLFFEVSNLMSMNRSKDLSLLNPPGDIATLYINILAAQGDMQSIKNLYSTDKIYKNFITRMVTNNLLPSYYSWYLFPILSNYLLDMKTVAISSDNKFAITKKIPNGEIGKWDFDQNKFLWTFKEYPDEINLSYNNDYVALFYTIFKDITLIDIHSTLTGELIKKLELPGYFKGSKVSFDNNTIAFLYEISNGNNVHLMIYDLDRFKEIKIHNSTTFSAESKVLDLKSEYFIINEQDKIKKYNISSERSLEFKHESSNLSSNIDYAITGKDHSKLLAKINNVLYIWEISSGILKHKLTPPYLNYGNITLNYDNSLTVFTHNNKIIVWDNTRNELYGEFELSSPILKIISGNNSNFIISITAEKNYFLSLDLIKNNKPNSEDIIFKTLPAVRKSPTISLLPYLSSDDSIFTIGQSIWKNSVNEDNNSHEFLIRKDYDYNLNHYLNLLQRHGRGEGLLGLIKYKDLVEFVHQSNYNDILNQSAENRGLRFLIIRQLADHFARVSFDKANSTPENLDFREIELFPSFVKKLIFNSLIDLYDDNKLKFVKNRANITNLLNALTSNTKVKYHKYNPKKRPRDLITPAP